MVHRRTSLILLSWLTLVACGSDRVAASGDETGGDEITRAPGHWLLYTATSLDPEEIVSLRAVDLGQLAQGGPGEPVELLEIDAYSEQGPTPWGAYAVAVDDAYMLVGLDTDGQIEVYPGVPEGVPAKARNPKFSADGDVALFHGEISSSPDDYYWVRFEHGRPVEGLALG